VDAWGIGADLVARTRALLDSLGAAELAVFLSAWPRPQRMPAAGGASSGAWREVRPNSLPVLHWLQAASADAPPFSAALAAALVQAAPFLCWRQSYTAQECDAGFLENYGWTELIGLRGALASERLACGFLLLAPETAYPRHRHEAAELYLPLAGAACWQQGDGVWRRRQPGTPIVHRGNEPHAMRTGERPLLALYLWRGVELARQARFERLPHG